MKAILVLEMPSACKDCPLRVSIDESICVKTLKDITDKEYFEQRPEWCPLRPAPEKRHSNDNLMELLADIVRNACIDEILGVRSDC